jgi:resuscitation-promoting factor RpfB
MNISDLIKKPLFQLIAAGLASVLGIALIVLSLHKTVFLVVNGQTEQVSTFALTVNSLLKNQGLHLTESERITPEPGTMLWGGEVIILNTSSSIEITANGDVNILQTAERRPANILLDLDLTLFPKDRILVDGQVTGEDYLLPLGESHKIQLIRGTPVTIEFESGNQQFISDADTLSEAFEKEGIEIFEADQLSKPLSTVLDGSKITVSLIRAKPLLVYLADESVTIRTTAETVGAALAQGGIALQGLDYSIPSELEPIPENDQVQIIRVREEILLKQEQIQFSSEYQPADDLALDQLQIQTGGEYGLQAQRLRIVYENDREVSRELEKEWVIREPSPRIIGYGTQINIETTGTADGQITYWRKITAYATSYDETCPGCNSTTSSGAPLKKGSIAVKLDWYRYMKGMRVYIPGYGFGTIEDVGSGVPWSANWVDLGYRHSEYVPWSRNVTVYFLAPAPPPDNIMYVLY